LLILLIFLTFPYECPTAVQPEETHRAVAAGGENVRNDIQNNEEAVDEIIELMKSQPPIIDLPLVISDLQSTISQETVS
jgi:hypothetical protein